MTLALRYALRSDVGLLREGNEDSAYAGPHLLVIADGMGGHAAGEVASAVAISAMAPLDRDAGWDMPPTAMLSELAGAVTQASTILHEMSIADPSVEGMGTTLTALMWSGVQVAICHIGDSRAYLLRDGELTQLTRDHTLVQALVDEGRLSPAAAATHPQRSLVIRALQGSSDAEPDLTMHQARLGDRYLLCSDGLSDVVTEATLHETLARHADRDEAVQALIDLAIRSGGPDNITCVLADVVDAGAAGAGAAGAGAAGAGPVGAGPVGAGAAGARASADGAPGDRPGLSAPQPPVQVPVVVGAAANGGGRLLVPPDSPAARRDHAHHADHADRADRADRSAGPDRGESDHAWDGPDGEEGGGQEAGPDGRDDDLGTGRGRRRWPVVTSVLAILVILIAVGGYAAWRYTRGQYYVGADGGQVAIYRGVNQSVLGLHLSGVYRRTGIPVSGIPASELSSVQNTIPATSLPAAQQVVARLRRGYTCKLAQARLATWQQDRPRPVTVKVRVHGKTVRRHRRPHYRPRPAVPAYCAQAGS